MRKIIFLLITCISLTTEASVVSALTKRVQQAFKSTKPSIELVAKGRILESNMDNLIVRTNSQMGKGEVLESIDHKIIEAEFRNEDMLETLGQLSQRNFNDRSLEKILMEEMRSVATISAHNHLILKKMSKEERAQYIAQHKQNVREALDGITSKISASGTYSFVSFKALRNIYMDLNSL
ncbi:hypothetical protein BMS_2268 [Halobacteriovorax marinus SJ]|uniref:DUF4142 domain-containing protein n=1 Tax=Halobacteriovorax marinus (strain ATCC BAA-682 / DSM 15412 / SJ) TaxID=862908 RepID=E1X498_HALMS|nr:hypothetical protein [Halobacteriovorax marinus]CBW27070.1 hypothetical protein BMS_2268 [Halobacteriovorax marinus SJ]